MDESIGPGFGAQKAVEQARILTCQASRVLATSGQTDMIWGHVGVRDPLGRGVWIKAPGWGLEEVTVERLQLVTFEAEVLLGEGAPHKECHIHLEIMRTNPTVRCTVHTHAVAAVAFGALGVPLLPISHEATLFGGDDVPRFAETGSLVSDPVLGIALARALGSAPAALMPKHGLVTAGATVPVAVMRAILLERACAIQLAASSAGGPRIWSDAAEAMAKRAQCWPDGQLTAGWLYLLRKTAATS
ncbi:class II aldolase/adducin family protein [Dactylosporangium sp. NPDC049525]|uniref:class II aldolase/adducin family protein n=1 Tax=Dactylosporangium sp. NPDC049525 TaxID=3154730 RepID=UPI00341A12DA